jgi:ABC-type Na+ efflux pump permease subunit
VNRVVLIARREWLELMRQRAMVTVIAILFILIGSILVVSLGLLELIGSSQAYLDALQETMPGEMSGELWLAEVAAGVIQTVNFLIFTQFLGITGVLAGHTVLHDRQCETLPFLLLSPLRRFDLLAGKVLGAVGIPMVLYLAVNAVSFGIASMFSVTAEHAAMMPPSPGWMVAFLIGGPAWALAISAVCAIISSVASDVRTAQQGVWFLLFFATLGSGMLLVGTMQQGVVVELLVAGAGLFSFVVAVGVGAQVISRDLSR